MQFIKSRVQKWRLRDLVRFKSLCHHASLFRKFLFFPFAAYGEYNDVTIQVANNRKQKLVNWDFECEHFLSSPFNFFLTCVFFPLYVARETRWV